MAFDPEPGAVTRRRIGSYEIEGLLGEGGIGQVYAARDTLLGRQVAIKTLRPENSGEQNLIDRFYVEAKSLANLNHPNITTLHALEREEPDVFMIMELVHGCTLAEILTRLDRLSVRESLAVMAQIVAGLAYAHRRGIVHRDIKPSNLMVTEEGVVKIMDFGIARMNGSQQLTRVGEFQGTLVYASPEQIRGETVDERSDLYSLAIVFYKMVSGTAPFAGNSDYALITAHLQTAPPPLLGQVPQLDAATEAALMRALAKQREDRFATVTEFGQAIGAFALRHDSVEILQQVFARALQQDDGEATKVVPTPSHSSIPAPTPSTPSFSVPRETIGPSVGPDPQSDPAAAGLVAKPAASRRTASSYLLAAATLLVLGAGAGAGWYFLANPAAPPASFRDEFAARLAAAAPALSKKSLEATARNYEAAETNKAEAVSLDPPGTWRAAGRPIAENAETSVLENCQVHYGQPCALLVVNEALQPLPPGGSWPRRDMPRVRYSGNFDPAQIPGARPDIRGRRDVVGYPSVSGPKAATLTPSSGRIFIASGSASQRAAEEEAFAACQADPQRRNANGACFLYAVGDRVVLPLRLTAPLTPATAVTPPLMPASLRDALTARLAATVPSASDKVREDVARAYEAARGHKAQAASLQPAGASSARAISSHS
jgi:serine/threonine protein kinase